MDTCQELFWVLSQNNKIKFLFYIPTEAEDVQQEVSSMRGGGEC